MQNELLVIIVMVTFVVNSNLSLSLDIMWSGLER